MVDESYVLLVGVTHSTTQGEAPAGDPWKLRTECQGAQHPLHNAEANAVESAESVGFF